MLRSFSRLWCLFPRKWKSCKRKNLGSKMLKFILKFCKVLQCVETMSRSRILVCFAKDYSTMCPYVLRLEFLLLLVYFTEELNSFLQGVSDSEMYKFSVDFRLR